MSWSNSAAPSACAASRGPSVGRGRSLLVPVSRSGAAHAPGDCRWTLVVPPTRSGRRRHAPSRGSSGELGGLTGQAVPPRLPQFSRPHQKDPVPESRRRPEVIGLTQPRAARAVGRDSNDDHTDRRERAHRLDALLAAETAAAETARTACRSRLRGPSCSRTPGRRREGAPRAGTRVEMCCVQTAAASWRRPVPFATYATCSTSSKSRSRSAPVAEDLLARHEVVGRRLEDRRWKKSPSRGRAALAAVTTRAPRPAAAT